MNINMNIHTFLDTLAAGKPVTVEGEECQLPEKEKITTETSKKIARLLTAYEANIGRRDLDNLLAIKSRLGHLADPKDPFVQKINGLIDENEKFTLEDLPRDMLGVMAEKGELSAADLQSLRETSQTVSSEVIKLIEALKTQAELEVDEYLKSDEFQKIKRYLEIEKEKKALDRWQSAFDLREEQERLFTEDGPNSPDNFLNAVHILISNHLIRKGALGEYHAKSLIDHLCSSHPFLAKLISAEAGAYELQYLCLMEKPSPEVQERSQIERFFKKFENEEGYLDFKDRMINTVLFQKANTSTIKSLLLNPSEEVRGLSSIDYTQILRKYPNLETLSIFHLSGVDVKLLNWILTHLKKIKKIELKFCKPISPEELQKFKDTHPEVEISTTSKDYRETGYWPLVDW